MATRTTARVRAILAMATLLGTFVGFTAAAQDQDEPMMDETGNETVVLMSRTWAEQACEAWNQDPILTGKLVQTGWVANDKDRGYKVIQMYRIDCEGSGWVELRIAENDGRAECIYGGPQKTAELAKGVDYVMSAKTERWLQMGEGNYGPMKGMMTRRLKFKGPKWEAMKNMAPFTHFLLLVGEVESDASSCPR